MSAENNPESFENICRHRQLLQPGTAPVRTIARQAPPRTQVRVCLEGRHGWAVSLYQAISWRQIWALARGTECLSWVKRRLNRHAQIRSALPPIADIYFVEFEIALLTSAFHSTPGVNQQMI